MKLWFKLEDGQVVLKECRLDRVMGRMCETRVPLGNEMMKVPKGTRLKVRGYQNHQGWWLQLPEPCKCCGLTGRITSVGWTEILIDGPVPVPPTKKALDAAMALGGEAAVVQMLRAWRRVRHYDGDDDDTDE